MHRWVAVLNIIFFCDVAVCAIIGGVLWSYRNGGRDTETKWLACVFLGLACEGIGLLLAHGFGYLIEPVPTGAFVACYLTGKSGRFFGLLAFARSMLRRSRKGGSV